MCISGGWGEAGAVHVNGEVAPPVCFLKYSPAEGSLGKLLLSHTLPDPTPPASPCYPRVGIFKKKNKFLKNQVNFLPSCKREKPPPSLDEHSCASLRAWEKDGAWPHSAGRPSDPMRGARRWEVACGQEVKYVVFYDWCLMNQGRGHREQENNSI